MPDDPPLPPDWEPQPGPQTDALLSDADILFYGGAAGGGKTDLLLGAAFKWQRRSIIFRREYAQLKAIIDRGCEIVGDYGRFNKSNMVWVLEDGVQVELGAVQHFGDERKYQGRPHDLKAFDELAHFSEKQFRTLCGWLRSADPKQKCRVIATGNPPTDGEGEWIIRFFAPWLDKTHAHPAMPGELRWYTTLDGRDTEVESGAAFEHDGQSIKPKVAPSSRRVSRTTPIIWRPATRRRCRRCPSRCARSCSTAISPPAARTIPTS